MKEKEINLIPTVKGIISSFILTSGELPKDLSFSTTTGAITGTIVETFEKMYIVIINVI